MTRASRMWQQGGCVTRVFMPLVISSVLLFCLAIIAAIVAPPSDEAAPTSDR